MKRYFTTFLLIICALTAVIGLAACRTSEKTYEVTVTCGENGTYALSPEQERYEENTRVTLTVTPNAGYEVDSVTENGKNVSLSNGGYTFTVTEDVAIKIAFKALTYDVSVDCGEEGSYTLSQTSGVAQNSEVTLTVSYDKAYYSVESVTVNGESVQLSEDKYTFAVTSDAAIVIRFRQIAYDVTVNCGEHGSYTLSHENPVAENTEVTLSVTPDEDYEADKVLVNGVETELVEGKCSFTVTKETTVEITFKELPGIFPEEYLGVWNPNAGAGSVGSSLEITSGTVIYNEKTYVPTVGDEGYTFQEIDEEGSIFTLTFELEEIFGEKYLLKLSFSDETSSAPFVTYYLKAGVDYYTYQAQENSRWSQVVGSWVSTGEEIIPLEITETGFMLGTGRGIVLEESKTDAHTPSKVLVENVIYTVHIIEKDFNIAAFNFRTEDNKTISFTLAAAMEPILVPQHAGTYQSEDKTQTVVVDEEGHFTYNGVTYELFMGDASGAQEFYEFTKDGVRYGVDFLKKQSTTTNYLWIRQEDYLEDGSLDEGVYFYAEDYPFTISYKVAFEVSSDGTYELTASEQPDSEGYYAGGTEITITVKAKEGFVINRLYLGNTYVDYTYEGVPEGTPGAHGKTEYTITLTLDNNYYDWYGTRTIRVYATFTATSTASVGVETDKEIAAAKEIVSCGKEIVPCGKEIVPCGKKY